MEDDGHTKGVRGKDEGRAAGQEMRESCGGKESWSGGKGKGMSEMLRGVRVRGRE